MRPDLALRVVDLAATLIFAIEGGRAAAVADLDLLGVMVVAFATALAGGIIRDVLIGDVPPAALRSALYPTVAFVGGGLVIVAYQLVDELSSSILTPLDAAGLASFCVTGATKALDHGMTGLMAVLLGTVTAVGGGVVRDVLLGEVPVVLRADVYAVAALAGAAALVTAVRLGAGRSTAMAIGGTACFSLRMVGVWLDWNLPRVGTG